MSVIKINSEQGFIHNCSWSSRLVEPRKLSFESDFNPGLGVVDPPLFYLQFLVP